MARKTKRREHGTGAVRQLPSGRWQAQYRDDAGKLRPAPNTFDTKLDAGAWLAGDEARQSKTDRSDPKLSDYAETWIKGRQLAPRSVEEYRRLLDGRILPTLGDVRLSRITMSKVREWHGSLDPKKSAARAQAYGLLRTILNTAVEEERIPANPCKIRGAGVVRTKHYPKIATLDELEIMVASVPSRYKLMLLLAAWCGLRFGELTELHRADVADGELRIQRGVVRVGGAFLVGDPKSQAGRRTVTLPPHLVPVLAKHLAAHVGAEPDALLFPAKSGKHMAPSTLYKVWYPAREAAGRKDLHFHDLRHTGATLAAATGATLADLMARMGHSTPAAAMRYQHAASGRDRAISDALSGFAEKGVVPLKAKGA